VTWVYVLVFVVAVFVVAVVLLGLAIFSVAKRSDSEWRRQHGCERRR
jgi:hypothetical protein